MLHWVANPNQAARAFVFHYCGDDVQRVIERGHELLEG